MIYVVDCNDHVRLETEAKEELHHLMAAEELKDAIFLIYANKQDMPGAVGPSDLERKLGMDQVLTKRWFIQSSIATRGDGLYDGLDWLCLNIE